MKTLHMKLSREETIRRMEDLIGEMYSDIDTMIHSVPFNLKRWYRARRHWRQCRREWSMLNKHLESFDGET